MKLRKTKKGFTIVELVIVIAVIGVLTAILVPTFVSLNKKANRASDNSLVTNLNTALASKEAEDGAKNATMYDAVEDLREYGFELKNLVAKSEEDLLWSMKENRFYLSDAEEVKSGKSYDFWHIQNDVNNPKGYSIYAGAKFSLAEVNVSAGFDAGDATGITAVNYANSEAREVVIRTNGDQCVLTVNAPNDNVDFYGFANTINVTAIKGESLHIYGSTAKLSLTSGHVEVEDTGIVFELSDSTGTVTNNGYIGENPTDAPISGKNYGGDYEINSLARLEAFRDTVNAGNNFAGKPVKLTTDITLKDGWRPIGEGSRRVAATGTPESGLTTFFAGTFDGQGHTISNLNNKGFVPTTARLVKDKDVDTYSYGLFALVDGATISNLKLEKVDIDGDRYQNARLDSAAGLVGYSKGDLTIENITVSGSLKGYDCISGIVGRINLGEHAVLIKDCTNNANINADVVASGIVRIYSGASGHSVTLTSNSNTGTITTNNAKEYYGGICVFTQTNVTLTHSGNMNKGVAATISAVAGTPDNSRLD